MKTFVVHETVVLVSRIEAEDKEEALAKIKARGVADFDMIDCSIPEKIEIQEDTAE